MDHPAHTRKSQHPSTRKGLIPIPPFMFKDQFEILPLLISLALPKQNPSNKSPRGTSQKHLFPRGWDSPRQQCPPKPQTSAHAEVLPGLPQPLVATFPIFVAGILDSYDRYDKSSIGSSSCTYPGGTWPVWISRITDPRECAVKCSDESTCGGFNIVGGKCQLCTNHDVKTNQNGVTGYLKQGAAFGGWRCVGCVALPEVVWSCRVCRALPFVGWAAVFGRATGHYGASGSA